MSFTTKKILLEQVRDGDPISLNEFYETYMPLVRLMGKSFRLDEPDIDDLVQQVMADFFKKRKTFVYDPQKGRFSNYFRDLVRTQLFKIRRAKMVTTDPQKLERLSMDEERLSPSFLRQWNHEYRQVILKEVIKSLKTKFEPRAFQAFHMTILQGVKPLDTAERLEISISAVYTIRTRGITYMKEMLKLAGIEEK